ncbi:MAG: beta-lactamase family protein [Clostridia bacterium]|nr:beta-lactamase family protein [Clostridia bacterium]MBQ4157837.1 beta-lactamase family protein [Clostridia bacterium]
MNTAFDPVARTLNSYIESNEIAGAAVRVRKDGKILSEACLGYSVIEKKQPVTSKTVFQLASMSKPITAVLGMTLVEDGKLTLSDPVCKYLPEFSHMPNLTVRMLFDHSSGILTGVSGAEFYPVFEDTLSEHVKRISKHPLEFENGKGTGYSGHGSFDVLGRLIEVVTGDTFEAYLKNRLTAPLNMPDTAFRPTQEMKTRKADLYEYTEEKTLKNVTGRDSLFLTVDPDRVHHVSGSAGMIGTLDDYERFVMMLQNEGALDGVRILNPETVRHMHTPSPSHGLEQSPGCIWGLGMMIFRDNRKSGRALFDGTYGWSGAYGTHFYIAPNENLIMTLMINRSNIGGAGSHVSFAVEKAIMELF